LRWSIVIFILAISIPGYTAGQGIEDSVFVLQTVEVKASRLFEQETAGMKDRKVDSLVMVKNINASLSSLLSENSSVFVRENGRGALATASFRGTASSHTRVNWNGIAINSPMTGAVDFSLIPVYIADDVGLAFGPASIVNGSGGIGGSVNISNSVDWNNTFKLKFIQGIGSYNTVDDFLQFGIGNSKFQSKTRLYFNYSKNDYTFINRGIAEIDPESGQITNPLDTNKNADYRKYGLLQELYFRLGRTSVLTARYWFQQNERTIPQATSYEGPDNSNLNRQDGSDHRLMAEWRKSVRNNSFSLRSAYTRKFFNYELVNYISGLGEVPAIYSESEVNSILNKVAYTHRFPKDLSLETSLDADYHKVSTLDSVRKSGYEKDRMHMSLFVALQKSYLNRLNIKLMARQDLIDGKITPVIPFFGFDWKILQDHELILRGNISRNYYYPSLNDMYWQPGGNPELEAEKGFSTELGLDYQLFLGEHMIKAGITGYYSDIHDWIIWIPTYKGYWEPQNIEQVRSKGIEIELGLSGKIGKFGYQLLGNYAYTSSINYGDPDVWGDDSYGKQLVYIPLHSANVLVNVSYQGFYVTYQNNSYSERHTTSSNDYSRRDWLYPYYMNDLMLGKTFNINKIQLGAEFRIYNLFDESYHTVLYRPMPGRNYMLMLMFSL
jgi:iron complex outermembrane receptor protein